MFFLWFVQSAKGKRRNRKKKSKKATANSLNSHSLPMLQIKWLIALIYVRIMSKGEWNVWNYWHWKQTQILFYMLAHKKQFPHRFNNDRLAQHTLFAFAFFLCFIFFYFCCFCCVLNVKQKLCMYFVVYIVLYDKPMTCQNLTEIHLY